MAKSRMVEGGGTASVHANLAVIAQTTSVLGLCSLRRDTVAGVVAPSIRLPRSKEPGVGYLLGGWKVLVPVEEGTGRCQLLSDTRRSIGDRPSLYHSRVVSCGSRIS